MLKKKKLRNPCLCLHFKENVRHSAKNLLFHCGLSLVLSELTGMITIFATHTLTHTHTHTHTHIWTHVCVCRLLIVFLTCVSPAFVQREIVPS